MAIAGARTQRELQVPKYLQLWQATTVRHETRTIRYSQEYRAYKLPVKEMPRSYMVPQNDRGVSLQDRRLHRDNVCPQTQSPLFILVLACSKAKLTHLRTSLNLPAQDILRITADQNPLQKV